MSEEIKRKFQEYVDSNTEETISIDSIPENVREKAEYDATLYGDSFVMVNRAPRWVERYLERQRWIDGIRDPEIDVLTGCTQNFKPQQEIDMWDAVFNTLDADKPDRNGLIWKREFLKKILNNRVFLTAPREHKSWLWLKLLEMELQKSYEINLVQTLETPPSTKVDLKSVIHMKWPKQNLSNLKAHDFRYGKMWEDQMLINYATGDVSHIDRMVLEGLAAFGPELMDKGILTAPNLNNDYKKQLERVIKKGRKRK